MSFLPYLQFSKVFHCGLILVESLEAGNGHNRVRRVATMKEFIRKYEDRIHGALSCFDRMLFRGYLPIMSGWAMAGFLDRLHQDFSSLKQFLLENSERLKCLHLYFYFMDRHFGLIHVRIQTWFPMPIQVYLNGHEWLARKLEANGVRFTKHDNAFLWIEDMVRAQKFSDRFANLNWP